MLFTKINALILVYILTSNSISMIALDALILIYFFYYYFDLIIFHRRIDISLDTDFQTNLTSYVRCIDFNADADF